MSKLILNYKFLNGILFYITWYACIYGAILGFEIMGVGVGVILIALHFWISKKRKADAVLLFIYLIIGIFGDYLLIRQNILTYPLSYYDMTMLGIPLWMMTLYASFSTTINHSLIFIHRFPLLASLFGGIGGAISYTLAAKIGVITLPFGWFSMVCIAIYWFLILLFSKWLHDLLESRIA